MNQLRQSLKKLYDKLTDTRHKAWVLAHKISENCTECRKKCEAGLEVNQNKTATKVEYLRVTIHVGGSICLCTTVSHFVKSENLTQLREGGTGVSDSIPKRTEKFSML